MMTVLVAIIGLAGWFYLRDIDEKDPRLDIIEKQAREIERLKRQLAKYEPPDDYRGMN